MSYAGMGQILDALASRSTGGAIVTGLLAPAPKAMSPSGIPVYGTVSAAVPVAMAQIASANPFKAMSAAQLFNAAMLDSAGAAGELRSRVSGGMMISPLNPLKYDPLKYANDARAALQRLDQAMAMINAGKTLAQVRAEFGVQVPPTPIAPMRVIPAAPSSASTAIGNASVMKADVDRLFRQYQATPYMDAVRRNNLRRSMLLAGRRLVGHLALVRPASELERLRLRALVASALASSQMRQRCYMAGTAGCGRFGLNEPSGPTKTNDEFVEMTRPLAALAMSRAVTTPIARPVPRVTVVVAGRPVVTVAPAATAAVVTAAKEGVTVAAAKLATDVATAQQATNPETKAAADKVVVTQAGADAAAKAAEARAESAQVAAQAATTATQVAQSTGAPADVAAAQVATQIADAAHATAEEATVAATEIAAVADTARSELEAVAATTNDTSAQQATTEATMTVAVATAGLGPLGISWKMWGIGAAALVGGYLFLNSRAMAKNRRGRVRRNRRRR